MIEKTTKMNMLYDFYQSLLTEKQKGYMELYYHEDYSLGEISTETNVSRQAIYDNIKRTEQTLETYEAKLKLYEKFLQREALLNELEKELTKRNETASLQSYIQQIKNID